MINSVVCELAKKIRDMRRELLEMVSLEARKNIENKVERDIEHIKNKFNEIREMETKYTYMNGVFSDSYIDVNLEELSNKGMVKAALMSLNDSGKIAIEQNNVTTRLLIPLNKNSEVMKNKIEKIIGLDGLNFIEKRIPMQDMIIAKNKNLYIELY